MEAVGLLGSDLGINIQGKDRSKSAQKLGYEAGQSLSQPSELCLVQVRGKTSYSHTAQSFDVGCLRKRCDVTAEGHLPAAFPLQIAGVLIPSFSKRVLSVHLSVCHRNSLQGYYKHSQGRRIFRID